MSEQLALSGFPVADPPTPGAHRDGKGRFRVRADVPPQSAEVATVTKGEFLFQLTLLEFPNLSAIIRYRSQGLGIRFYDTMLGTDPDLAGFFQDLNDDVLHYPWTVRAASDDARHREMADFVEFAIRRIPHYQNALRNFLDSHARGFSVTEKIYEVIPSGKWKGAVAYAALLDKPQRWFSFDPERNLRFRTYKNFYPGELVPQEKFAVVTFGSNSDPWGEAILDLCYWPWFMKHYAMKSQAVFYEKWGSPTVLGTYKHSAAIGADELNKLNKQKTLDVAMAIQNDQVVAVPEGIMLKLLESMRSGTVSFEAYIDQLTKMESRIVTGQILSSMGDKGGSFALGKVHEKRESNKVEMLAMFLSQEVNRQLVRELIDRNYGPQDVYPMFQILARAHIDKQAWLEVEQLKLANGHNVSKAWSDDYLQNVLPSKPEDELVPIPSGQTKELPISPALGGRQDRIALAHHAPKPLLNHARAKGKAKQAKLHAIGHSASKKAKRGIHKVVKHIAKKLKTKKAKKAKTLTRKAILTSMKGAPAWELGQALQQMLHAPKIVGTHGGGQGEGRVPPGQPTGGQYTSNLAEGDDNTPEETPPEISTSAKLALALQMLAIAERINDAAADAPDEMDTDDFADSLTDPNGAAVDQAFSNMFEGTHGTDIASVATAALRAKLADPAYREQFPYVMIVTQPDARLPHRVLDGFLLSAEDAQYSPFLPPFGFGCRCQAVPIPAAEARANGLTGAAPTGTVDAYAKANGLPDRVYPGAADGFSPAYQNTDRYVQLQALRQKSEELRAEDPQGWAEWNSWLLWLFLGLDVLRKDPPPDEEESAA